MATRLILIRHGVTDWNLKKKYCGFVDVSLSKKGKAQAKLLQQRLKAETVHKIYASDRKRALQTAKIIFKDRNIQKCPGLREMHFGIFEGLTHKEILKKHGKVYKKWLSDPYNVTVPKGERFSDFRKRIIDTVKKKVSLNPDKTLAMVSHGGSISVFLTHILKTKDFWKQIPKAASISIIEYKKGKPRVIYLNNTSHLS